MKKVLVLFLVLTCVLSLAACNKATSSEEPATDGAVSDAIDASENVSGETEQTQQEIVESTSETVSNVEEKQDDDTEELALAVNKEVDYKNAISDDDLDDLLKTMTEYYQEKLSCEIIDYRIADNDHSLYPLHQDYEPGNIIVFEVHTTSDGDVYRIIMLGRENDKAKWEVITEGF
jgi:flavodoxin